MANNSDGSVIIGVDLSLSQAEKKLKKLEGDIDKTGEKINDLTNKRDQAEQEGIFKQDVLDAEKKKLEEIKTKLLEAKLAAKDKERSSDVRQTWKDIIPKYQIQLSEQQERVRALQSEWNATQKSVEKYDNQILNANMQLDQQKAAAGQLATEIERANSPAERFKNHMQETGENVEKVENRLKKLVSRVMIFSVFTAGLRSLRKWMSNIIKTNDEATKSLAQLKGAFLTLVQPLANIIIPTFIQFVNILTKIVATIAQVIAILFGTTAKDASEAAKNLYEEQQAISGVGSAAKQAEKALAGFDEINKLTSEGSSGAVSTIKPDFSAVNNIPDILKNFLADMELKIKSLKISWDNKDFTDKDLWITAIMGILGAVTGLEFFGLPGGVIGALIGASLGIASLVFLDKTSGLTEEQTGLFSVLGAILGGILGAKFGGGISGGVLGLLFGGTISFLTLKFLKSDQFTADEKKSLFESTLKTILSTILGAKFGGIKGAIIGFLFGVTISLISMAFEKAQNGDWDSRDTKIVVLSAILGAILGTVFGGFNPAFTAIGLFLGAIIGFNLVKFAENDYQKDEAIATFRIVIFAILGAVIGALGLSFLGPVGTGVGFLIGLTVGFASVAFDDSIDAGVRSFAEKGFYIAISTILGAIIGSVFPGIGTAIGAVIGLTFGLAISFGKVTTEDLNSRVNNTIKKATTTVKKNHPGMSIRTYSLPDIPRLAQGAVIPPNREFMAVLGDQKNGTNIEAPAELVKQMAKEGMQEILGAFGGGFGGGEVTVILEIDHREFARTVYKLNREETQRVGVRLVNGR